MNYYKRVNLILSIMRAFGMNDEDMEHTFRVIDRYYLAGKITEEEYKRLKGERYGKNI